MIVNLNTICRVQLSELGKMIWLSQIDSLSTSLEDQLEGQQELIEAIKSSIDENDCLELELWKIMNIFGRYISPQQSPFLLNTINLKRGPIFKTIS